MWYPQKSLAINSLAAVLIYECDLRHRKIEMIQPVSRLPEPTSHFAPSSVDHFDRRKPIVWLR
jgi:hypothetical protein